MSKILLTSGSVPETPISGKIAIFLGVDKKLKIKDDAGLVTDLTLTGFGSKDDISGLKLTWLTTATIQIEVGDCVDETNLEMMEVTTPLSLDITLSGDGGLDTGSEQSDKHYFVWLLKRISTGLIGRVFSLSDTSPTLPAAFPGGDTAKRFLGQARNDGPNLLEFYQIGKRNNRKYFYLENVAGGNLEILSSGTATSYNDVDASSLIPPNATLAIFWMRQSAGMGTTQLRTKGAGNMVWKYGQEAMQLQMPTDTSQLIRYLVTGGGVLSIAVVGYEQELKKWLFQDSVSLQK